MIDFFIDTMQFTFGVILVILLVSLLITFPLPAIALFLFIIAIR